MSAFTSSSIQAVRASRSNRQRGQISEAGSLDQKLGYVFRKPELLLRALTHRSYSQENNERLEFLGDGVLGCIMAKHLYGRYPQLSEGDLSRLRSSLVREETLALLARQLGLGEQLRLGEGELKSGGSCRPSMLADALEALFGAVFLDGGFESAEKAVLNVFVPCLEQMELHLPGKDAKTQLQEYLQGQHVQLPKYTVIATQGAAHAQTFRVECAIPALNISAVGEGSSRRNAEQQAAQQAYMAILKNVSDRTLRR
jgi:ribonuclease-3